MKKIAHFLSLAALLMTGLPMQAQIFDRVAPPDHSEEVIKKNLPTEVQAYLRVGPAMGLYGGENSRGTDPIFSYMAEMGVNIPFNDPTWGFQPALRLVMKGAKMPYDVGDKPNLAIHQQYVEVPLYFSGTFAAKEKSFLRMAMGPFIAYGISGNAKYRGVEVSTFGANGLAMRRFDMGVGYEFTYQYQHFQLTLGMDTGFIPALGKDDDGNRFPTNGSIYLNVGYAF